MLEVLFAFKPKSRFRKYLMKLRANCMFRVYLGVIPTVVSYSAGFGQI